MQVGDSSFTGDYLLIFIGVSLFIFVAIVVAGLVKCRRTANARKDQTVLEKMHGQIGQSGITPMPLPRPPDHLMPSPIQGTPSIKRYTNVVDMNQEYQLNGN